MTNTEIFALTLRWWLVVQIAGLLALPLAYRALRWLPGRGYALVKTLGLLLSGYLLWALGSLGFLRNTMGGIVFALLLVGLLSVLVYRNVGRAARRTNAEEAPGETVESPEGLWTWLGRQRGLVLATEVVFAVVLFGWAFFRAHNPHIVATEKPMEFAFLNSILRDPLMPPSDPWLSGYAISYYYFGYIVMAMLVQLTGVAPGVGFNLAIALLMALSAVGAFGLGYELVALGNPVMRDRAARGRGARSRTSAPVGAAASGRALASTHWGAVATGLLAALLLVVMANWEAPLEYANANRWFPADFWAWADIKELTAPGSVQWPPTRFWWWWRASRVIHDCNPMANSGVPWPCGQPDAPNHNEVIDEFPFFSFLLADMHPHVLSLPFTLLALGLGLNLLQRAWVERWGKAPSSAASAAEPNEDEQDARDPAAGLQTTWRASRAWLVRFGWGHLLLYAVCLGALGFFNTWDFPTYLAVVAGGLLLALWHTRGRLDRVAVGGAVWIGACLAALGLVLYLPFWIGFRSQLGGVLPNLVFPTRVPQFLIFWGPFIVLHLCFLFYLAARLAQRRHFAWQEGLAGGLGVMLALWAGLAAFVAFAVAFTAEGQDLLFRAREYLNLDGSSFELVLSALRLRASEMGVPLGLALGLALVLGVLVGAVSTVRRGAEVDEGETSLRSAVPAATGAEPAPGGHRAGTSVRPSVLAPSTLFALMLVGLSMAIVLVPEFFYLRDLFGSRINMIFKFYYQAWVLSAIAGAFAVHFLLTRPRPALRAVFGTVAFIAVLLGMVYPFYAAGRKLAESAGDGIPTLDGMVANLRNSPDLEGVRWLNANVSGQPVILEVVGGSYSEFGRVSANTGLPTVLGWPGHEDQWRGTQSAELKGTRENDVNTIYGTRDWQAAADLLDRYNVEYVYVGPLERNKIPPGQALQKFGQHWLLVFTSSDGQVEIYQRTGPVAEK